jgi:hypothetical protein
MELDSSRDAPPFTLQADEVEVQVCYARQDGLLWLTTGLPPIETECAPALLPALLRWNFANVRAGRACALDSGSAVVILQSWIACPDVHLGLFETVVARHVTAARELADIAARPPPAFCDDSSAPQYPAPPTIRGAAPKDWAGQRLAELLALMNHPSARLADDANTLCLPFVGGLARLELAHDEGPCLRASYDLPLQQPPLLACLRMLDTNLFAQCGGGMFALDGPGTVHLLRHLRLDDLADLQVLRDAVAAFVDEAGVFRNALPRPAAPDAAASAPAPFDHEIY